MTSSRGDGVSDSLPRRRPNFSTRTPQEDESRLDPSESVTASPEETARLLNWQSTAPVQSYGTVPFTGTRPWQHSPPLKFLGRLSSLWNRTETDDDVQGQYSGGEIPGNSVSAGPFRDAAVQLRPGNGEKHRPSDASEKFGTFSGVFVPTSLNVLSILMFLRFGFILGQAGLLGILGEFEMLSATFELSLINLRPAGHLLHNQSSNHNVVVCHRNQWHSQGRRSLLSDISFTGS
jgi:potassium/chloride transporter 9